jgi:hypothetical protein
VPQLTFFFKHNQVSCLQQQQQQQQQQQHIKIEASLATATAQRHKEQKDHKEQTQQIEMLTKLLATADRHTSIERTNELEFIRTAIIEAHCQIWPTTFEKIRHRYLERPPVRATNTTTTNTTTNNNNNNNNCQVKYPTNKAVIFDIRSRDLNLVRF